MWDSIASTSNGDTNWIQGPGILTGLDHYQRAWVEVSPAAITSNARTLVKKLNAGCCLMAVVKADGYGHGAVTVARAAITGGASQLGVATLPEGIQLRQANLQVPILVLGNLTHVEELRACLHWRLMPSFSGMREALLCQKLAADSGRRMATQLKLDTGMARLGCAWQEAPQLIKAIRQLRDLDLVGVYSHLALAEARLGSSEETITLRQQRCFEEVTRSLQASASNLCCHLANSAATLRGHLFHYDMVRVGLALYGYAPAPHLETEATDLKPALAVKAKVTLIRDVPAGTGVSYGHHYVTTRASRLAVVAIGYADGVSRALSGRISVLSQGYKLPQVGVITMDQLLIDSTDHPSLDIGSTVTLLGREGDQEIALQDWSNHAGLIPWEVLCGFRHRLPRLEV